MTHAMTFPSFTEFFVAVHGYAPFPWQARLAEEVLRAGWPSLLDLPTGSGKTSALDVALYALAAAPERMPRRTLLVVDRRIVVDQGAEHARSLRRKMGASAAPAAAAVADRLRALWGAASDEAPFAIATMRGGMPRDNDWARRPDQPVLGVSTIDQVGSRLLFRGYGVSPRSASIHAGLLGNDTLILLDEVHLATAFAETLQVIGERYRDLPEGLPDRFAVVRMSATPGQPRAQERVFPLDEQDRAHPVLQPRLRARKPARLVRVDVRGDQEASKRATLATHAVAEALALQQAGAQVVAVVVNRVDTARLAWTLLAKHVGATDRLLVTGRMRPIDRDRLVHRELLPRTQAGRARGADARPLVVVATQCIEAGADLDFDGMVSECASLDALRQRFGRVDRRGELAAAGGGSSSVILCRSDLASDRTKDPVYGTALAATWTWLQACATDQVIDVGIEHLPALPEDPSPLLAPVSHAPVLLPAHLDAWAHTSPLLAPSPEPDPALWLHGPQRATSDVQVVWRADLLDDHGEPREVSDAFREELARVRPSSLEAMSLPVHAVHAWLSGGADATGLSDAITEVADDDERSPRRGGGDDGEAGQQRRVLLLGRGGDAPQWIATRPGARSSRRGEPSTLRPGMVVLVPSSYGGINGDGTFDPEVTEPVTDLGDLAQLRGRGQVTLRIADEALRVWGLDPAVRAAAPRATTGADGGAHSGGAGEVASARELKDLVKTWAASWPAAAPPAFLGTAREWTVARSSLLRLRRAPTIVEGDRLVVVEPVAPERLRDPDRVSDAVSEDDDSSFRAREVTLQRHSGDVRDWARRFADGIGFATTLAEDVALAAWLHDLGKADPRFQRWLVGGDEVRASLLREPLAKSGLPPGNLAARRLAQQRAGYPVGYRHELLSLEMIEHTQAAASSGGPLHAAHDRELVLHLVASHHGWCRPFAPALDHPDDFAVTLTHDGLELEGSSRHRKALANSGVSARFWSLIGKYGWWGLAWLEAVLRLADHRASEQEAREPDPPATTDGHNTEAT